MIAGALISTVGNLIGKLVDKAVPDRDEALKLKAKLNEQLNSLGEEELKSQTSIIMSEAKGGSWLQRNWRPMTMITFLVLLVMYWLGIQPDQLTQETINNLFDLLKIGIGGYILGRSTEKSVKLWKDK